MATIKAYILRTSKKNTESNIHLRLNGGSGIDISSVIPKTVLPERWNDRKEELKSSELYKTEKVRNAFNKDIVDLKDSIIKSFEKVDRTDVNKQWLDTEIDKYYHPEKYEPVESDIQITLFEFVEKFIQTAPTRKVSKTGALMNKRAIVQHQITFDYLKTFAIYNNKTEFEFSDMNKSFYDEFVKYLQTFNLASNTLGQKIKHLKLWLKEA